MLEKGERHSYNLLTTTRLIPILVTMEQMKMPVIYQDHHLLIVNKPAGLVIHPTYKHADGTMWDAILEYLEEQGGDDWLPPELPDEPEWLGVPKQVQSMLRNKRLEKMWKEDGLLPKPCLLHRLDKDTSGIVALARTENSRRHVVRQFLEHNIVKQYLAVVKRGTPDWIKPRAPFKVIKERDEMDAMEFDLLTNIALDGEDEFMLNGALQRDPNDRRRCIVGPDGQQAKTMIKVMATEGEFVLLKAQPITGRTHQIRAHLAAFGYAIVGDETYSSPAKVGTPAAAMKRQFLHAFSLEFRRYPDNQLCSFVAPLAADLKVWLENYFPIGLEVMHASKTIRA
jgi:23S rRNA pseudouridine1911/1915/1917 synthase